MSENHSDTDSKVSLTKEVYRYTTQPHHRNMCSHGGYLFSFSCIEKEGASPCVYTETPYDVYCYEARNYGGIGQKFCLRFGSDSPDYCSPGSIKNIIQCQHLLERYKALVELLMENGEIVFRPYDKH